MIKVALPIVANSEHARFGDDITEIGAVEAVGQLDE